MSMNDWDTGAVRYMQPKVNERGGKSINVISTQTNRSLHVSTPLLMTWGISDFVGENGESDGKFSMSLSFPNEQYHTAQTRACLEKFRAFENQILDDAVKNGEVWFGEEMSREVAKHTFFPFLKYPKDSNTKKTDYTKSPTLKARVPNYNNKWNVEVYDTSQTLLFPSEDDGLTPMDFVPKKSHVACVLQCGGLWFGGKGWGITWKLTQCVVKPTEVISVLGRCHIQLTDEELSSAQVAQSDDEASNNDTAAIADTPVVDDSEEDEDEEEEEPVVVKPVIKRKKKVEPESEPESEPQPKKKVVRKKTA
tara:strand:+ start:2382 stop:3305 length:924 start_codon:yes stop_codon:yes gene_type:complete